MLVAISGNDHNNNYWHHYLCCCPLTYALLPNIHLFPQFNKNKTSLPENEGGNGIF